MLILSRKKGESIVIGNGIVVKVVEVCCDKVKIGIDAPREVPVHRSEIAEKINACGSSATKTPENGD